MTCLRQKVEAIETDGIRRIIVRPPEAEGYLMLSPIDCDGTRRRLIACYRLVLEAVPDLRLAAVLSLEKPLDAEHVANGSEVRRCFAELDAAARRGRSPEEYERILDDLRAELRDAKHRHQERMRIVDNIASVDLNRPPTEAVERAREGFRSIDLNELRDLGQEFAGFLDTNLFPPFQVEVATSNFFRVLRRCGLLSLLTRYETDIRRLYTFERLPVIDRVLFPPDELQGMASEVQAGPSIAGQLEQPLPTQPEQAQRERNWRRIARGASLACMNGLYGGLLVAGSGPRGLLGVFAPSGWEAVLSVYTGVWQVVQGWQGEAFQSGTEQAEPGAAPDRRGT